LIEPLKRSSKFEGFDFRVLILEDLIGLEELPREKIIHERDHKVFKNFILISCD